MRSYALLVHPSANRVYAEASAALTVAELGVLARPGSRAGSERRGPTVIAGVRYVAFDADLADGDLALLGDVSTAMALFERGRRLAAPVELPRRDRFDADLLTILKYPGKTNEVFTKLLLNVTVWSGNVAVRPPAARARPDVRARHHPQPGADERLARPGLDVDGRDFDTYAAFLRTWLKIKRLKHDADVTPVRREGVKLGRRLHAEVGGDQGGVEGRSARSPSSTSTPTP